MGNDAEHQLCEAVARGVPFPQRERSRLIGATQLGQEPLHRHLTWAEAESHRVRYPVPRKTPPPIRTAPHFRLQLGPAHSCRTSGASKEGSLPRGVEFLGPGTYAAASASSLPESRTARLKTFVPSFNIASVGGGEGTRWQGRALGQGREGPLEANLSAGAVRPALLQASARVRTAPCCLAPPRASARAWLCWATFLSLCVHRDPVRS